MTTEAVMYTVWRRLSRMFPGWFAAFEAHRTRVLLLLWMLVLTGLAMVLVVVVDRPMNLAYLFREMIVPR